MCTSKLPWTNSFNLINMDVPINLFAAACDFSSFWLHDIMTKTVETVSCLRSWPGLINWQMMMTVYCFPNGLHFVRSLVYKKELFSVKTIYLGLYSQAIKMVVTEYNLKQFDLVKTIGKGKIFFHREFLSIQFPWLFFFTKRVYSCLAPAHVPSHIFFDFSTSDLI